MAILFSEMEPKESASMLGVRYYLLMVWRAIIHESCLYANIYLTSSDRIQYRGPCNLGQCASCQILKKRLEEFKQLC